MQFLIVHNVSNFWNSRFKFGLLYLVRIDYSIDMLYTLSGEEISANKTNI